MTFSALGISIEIRGADESARRLDAVSTAARKIDAAVEKIAPSSKEAGAGLERLGRGPKTTEGALEGEEAA